MLTHSEISVLAELIAQEIKAIISSEQALKRWMTLREAMEYARVKSRDTIYRWINEGYIYGFKRSGDWIVDRESIDDWYKSEAVSLNWDRLYTKRTKMANLSAFLF